MKRYTAEDDRILSHDYLAGIPVQDIANKFGRSMLAIKMRVFLLGLRRLRRRDDYWTAEDNNILRRDWLNHRIPIQEIADKLGRSVSALRSRATVLGLGRRHFYTVEDDHILRRDWDAGVSLADIARKLDRSELAISHRVYSLGLRRRRLRPHYRLETHDSARLKTIKTMRNAGATLQTIGLRFGITRERVRQILDETRWREVK
jgi:hypothetical protein